VFRSDELHRTLLEAIDEALFLFGLGVRDVTYYYCESRYGAKRDEIPFKLNCFLDCLYEIYGLAAKMIEAQIIKQLEVKLRVKVGVESLTECLNRLKSYVEVNNERPWGLA